MLWIFSVAVVAVAATHAQNANTKFSCDGRTTGYYADVNSGCQVYHMCDGLGRQFSYTCPNATLFQQRMLICDHWYMVNCSKSESDYGANLRIGQKEMPFVDDSESNPYHRTPRPDLLSHPTEDEYNIIYRTGRAQFANNQNLVGAESEPDTKNNTTSPTDKPLYFLPSHWSTQYSKDLTTFKPFINKEKPINSNTKKTFVNSNSIKGKPVNPTTESSSVNYKSAFKNTTPVFPRTVDVSTEAPDDAGILPPLPYQLLNKDNNNNPQEVTVNFQSDFQATTPVYPKTVEATSAEPGDLGILPPLPSGDHNESNLLAVAIPSLSLDFEPPKLETNYTRDSSVPVDVEVSQPSQFYQPPKYEPDYTELVGGNLEPAQEQSGEKWDALRKKLLIPDYDFPLETVSRPSYDTVFNSFQASAAPADVQQ